MMLTTSTTVYFALIFLLAGVVKGVVGLGLPTVAMGLLSLRMPPAEAAAMLLLHSFITNVWQLAEGSHLGNLIRRLWPTLLTIFISTAVATGIIASTTSAVAIGALDLDRGRAARDLLARGCPLDLDPRSFAADQCAQTLLARVDVILFLMDDRDAFGVLVRASFARYLVDWLRDAIEGLES